jgi:universal stress protein A
MSHGREIRPRGRLASPGGQIAFSGLSKARTTMKTLFRKILVPHDLSEHASRALALAAELARVHRGELTVLHVIAPYQPVLGFPEGVTWNLREEDIITSARRSLEEMVARVLKGARAPRTRCRVVLGDPLQRILAAARDADSIVIATAGRTGLSHLLIGSVAEKVVRHASVPVLTIRPPAKRRASTGPARATRRR